MVLRVDRAFQAFFRRVKAGETPGYPRFHGRDRYCSFSYPQVGEHGGATLDGGLLSLSRIGRIPILLHRPLEGAPKSVTISVKRMAGTPVSPALMYPYNPYLPPDRRRGLILG